MLRLITTQDCHSQAGIAHTTQQLRDTFTDVFSNWYTQHLAPALKQELKTHKKIQRAALAKSTNRFIKGFSDLLMKEKFFNQDLPAYRNSSEVKKVFIKIFQGPGFDDDAAFIIAFHDLKTSGLTPREHYTANKDRLSAVYQAEVEDYLNTLEKSGRQLLEVNFAALIDKDKKMQGFAINHVLIENGSQILHVRQSAMRQQNRGYASLIASYFTDKYPQSIYEANQRNANPVLMKSKLVHENLLTITTAVLGYNPNYYLGLRGNDTVLKLFLIHHRLNHANRPLYRRAGVYYDTESIYPFFSQVRLQKDLFALQDDNYCKNPLATLRRGNDIDTIIAKARKEKSEDELINSAFGRASNTAQRIQNRR
jgi:hypothetical protein